MANLSRSADSIVLNQIKNLTTTLEKINSLEILRTSTSTTTTTTTSPKITINSFFPEFYDLGYSNPNESKDNNTNNLLLKSSEIFGLVPTDYDGSILFDNKSLLFQDDQDYSSSSNFYNDTFSSDQLISQLKTPLFYILFMLLIYGAIILVVFMSAIYSHRKRAGYSYEDDECSSSIEHRRLDEEEDDVVNEVKRSRRERKTKPRVYLKDEAKREPESLLLNENVKKYDIGCEDIEEELGPMSDDIVVDLVEDYSSDSSEEVGSDDEQQQQKHSNRDRTEWSFGATIKNMIASTRLLKAKGLNQMVGESEGIIGDNKLFKKKRYLGDSAENEVLMSSSACGGEFDTNLNDGVMSDGVYLSCVMKPLSITKAKSNRLDENRF